MYASGICGFKKTMVSDKRTIYSDIFLHLADGTCRSRNAGTINAPIVSHHLLRQGPFFGVSPTRGSAVALAPVEPMWIYGFVSPTALDLETLWQRTHQRFYMIWGGFSWMFQHPRCWGKSIVTTIHHRFPLFVAICCHKMGRTDRSGRLRSKSCCRRRSAHLRGGTPKKNTAQRSDCGSRGTVKLRTET